MRQYIYIAFIFIRIPMKTSWYIIFSILLVTSATAQKQNNNWCFGIGGGVDFNTSPPTPFESVISANEGAASISDPTTGKLLFYTDGVSVWDSKGTIMPNGAGIGDDNIHTTQQGSVIVPFPGDANKYYIFTLDNQASAGTLAYSIVDMTLNAGRGDVVSGRKKIAIKSDFAEGMTVYPACTDGVWLIVFERKTNYFFSYRISSAGISTTPVVSTTAYAYQITNLTGMKISPDGKYLAQIIFQAVWPITFLALHDFDAGTGAISNTRIIDMRTDNSGYSGVEFSPNSSKLYAKGYYSSELFQYDLSNPSTSAIIASQSVVVPEGGVPFGGTGDIQLAPDGNIYIAGNTSTFLAKLTNPDMLNPGCKLTRDAIPLSPNTQSRLSLPQFIHITNPGITPEYSNTDLVHCKGTETKLNAIPGRYNYQWHNGSSDTMFTATAAGKYWIESYKVCTLHTDTFTLNETDLGFDLGNDTGICGDATFKLVPSPMTNGVSYLWQDNTTSDNYIVKNTGKYWLSVADSICSASDTIIVYQGKAAAYSLGNDTSICAGGAFQLNAPPGLKTYRWHNRDTGMSFTVSKAGMYSVATTDDKGCKYSDTIIITGLEDPSFDIGNDTTICKKRQLTLSAGSLPGSVYTWSDNVVSNHNTATVTEQGTYYVTVENKCGTFTDSINVYTEECDCEPFIPSAFTPNNDGLNDKLKPKFRCIVYTYKIIIANRWGGIVFTTTDPDAGWDGTLKGSSADVGTYVYYMQVTFTNGQRHTKEGDVALIR